METSYQDRGIWLMVLGWVLVALDTIAVVLRIYSRLFLTHSAGSDDLSIAFALCILFAGSVFDTMAVYHGLGRHSWTLTPNQVNRALGLYTISWISAFVRYFFIRGSVMLFTLRLLPSFKKWPRRIIYLVFLLNFAITIIACVVYGIKCIPFHAIWETSPKARCLAAKVDTAAQITNGTLACVIDIITALVPAFLLDGVCMRRSTKIALQTIFGLGLATAALSIGRAATTNQGVYETDETWRLIPSSTFGVCEERLGIIFASGPALRQFVAYVIRHKTMAPGRGRHPPSGADFVSMRKRVTVRDILWYRKPDAAARELMQDKASAPSATDAILRSADVQLSPLDKAENKVGKVFERIGVAVRRPDAAARPLHSNEGSPMSGVEARTASEPPDDSGDNISSDTRGTFLWTRSTAIGTPRADRSVDFSA